MKNKINYKKFLTQSYIVIILFTLLFTCLNILEYQQYKINFNEKIAAFIELVENEYPEVVKNELIVILNSDESYENILKEYGYDLNKDSYVKVNDKVNILFTALEMLVFSGACVLILLLYHRTTKKNDQEIAGIIQCIEDINHKNYDLHIEEISEDQLSILKNEIYKTTILLKEQAENSMKDKLSLKDSLQDISHQLKTPLTSINIMLENIMDDPKMEIETREYFIKQIRREMANINFLVQSILKLSKFETNTIHFIKENIFLSKIIDEAMMNVSNLCDLKNATIEVINTNDPSIYCDFNWQVEAVTNILKNAVEYSNNGGKVSIECSDNQLYSQIKITDSGIGMDEEDTLNIFKRFYRGKDASKDSIGIGLALSKAIVENDNGRIFVDSEKGKGTSFTIKYFKN